MAKTLWQTLTAKEKASWHLHGIINRICWKTKWKYPWLKRLNNWAADPWVDAYIRFGRERSVP